MSPLLWVINMMKMKVSFKSYTWDLNLTSRFHIILWFYWQGYLCREEECLKPFYLRITTKVSLPGSLASGSVLNNEPTSNSVPVHWTIVGVGGVPFILQSPGMADPGSDACSVEYYG